MTRWLIAILLAVSVALANDPPIDTMEGKYILSYVNKDAYRVLVNRGNYRKTAIIVPPGSKVGDTLIVREVWLSEESVQLRKQRTAQGLQDDLSDLEEMLLKIDSAYSAGGGKP